MAPARVAGIDFTIGFAVMMVAVVEITGNAVFWTMPLGSYMHQLMDDSFYALFLFLSGVRTTFIATNVLNDGPKLLKYFTVRGLAVLLLGLIFYFTADSVLLIHLAILLFASILLTQLNSSILYFSGFLVFMLALVLPLSVSSSPNDVFKASSWWADFLYLRTDALVPLAMYFIFGLEYGRRNFLDVRWSRLARIFAVLILIAAFLTHFASEDYFRSSYLIIAKDYSRLLPFSALIYRPVFLIGIIPACILLFQLGTYLSKQLENSPSIYCFLRAGQNHLSYLSIGLLLSSLLHLSSPHPDLNIRLIAWLYALLAMTLCVIFRKQFKSGPVEWLVQRFY